MHDLRQDYNKGQLLESDIPSSPIKLYEAWFNDARDSEKITEPNAMILSTAMNGKVNSRTVLLKDQRLDQFIFYSNYRSRKGEELGHNPNCSLLFPWVEMERQVIISGVATKIPRSETEKYFHSRPRKSQIGAWVSDQSEIIKDRASLIIREKELSEKFENKEIPCPPHWGGYSVLANQIEFWQGRTSRLHDRIVYKNANNKWSSYRVQP